MILNIRNKFLFIFLIGLTSIANAQTTGTIKGTLIDSLKNEVIANASIQLVGTNKGASSNSRGEFTLSNVKSGKYSIAISCIGYETDTISNIILSGNIVDLNKINLNQALQSFSGGGKAVARKTNSIKAGIQEIKKAEVVANNITSEQISRSQDGDAAKAAARVPGVTLLENRFIMLRGLSQRYNSVQINGINAPSTEVDRRAFSFDLIPSSMLDKIMIFKSPASDLSGDFAGGVIKISTKSNVERDFLTIGFGLGYRLGTTFSKAQHNSVGSSTDLLGFDNGNRDIPNGFPASIAGYNISQSILYGQMLRNNFELSEIRTPLDFGWSLSQGKNFKIKKMKLYTTNSIGYSTNYINAPTKRYRYQYDQLEYVKQMFDYTDDNFTVESKISILSNWILKINKNHTIAFKNIFNQIGENETTVRNGANPTERPQDEFRNYGFHYTSRSIYFGQLEGNLNINEKNDKLNYGLGFSNINRNEPDYRRFRTSRIIGSNDEYSLIDPPSASLFDAARFYSILKENTISATVNYEKHFHNKIDSLKDIILRVGTYLENKNRNFDARWISYGYVGNPLMKNDILKQPINQIFSLPNINSTAGFKPNEGTNPNDKYTANNQLIAGYLNATIPLGIVSFNLGTRIEQFNQSLTSATQNGPVEVLQPNFNVLPSINSTLYLSEKKLLRAGYGKTVNRPEFRELAPFVYYDFMYDVNIVGNPDLKSATIDNFDLRYEYYPSSSETVSFGAFYKKFINPIENYVQPIGLSQQFYLQNAKGANNYGVELEMRKSLENETQNLFLKKLSINFNASYIISKVDLGDDSTLSQDKERALQGQSPYIINTSIMYNDDKKKLNVNLAYNIFGERIAYVGNAIFPTVYEMPRHSLDLTLSKDVSKRLSLKFGISDLLNYKSQLWQDTDNDGKINMKKDKTDHQLMEFRRGQMINFNLSYKLK